MARLKGDLNSIDLTVPFSIRSGGRIFDLSKGLDFEIVWDGSNIIDRFTGDILTGSGHTATSGPAMGAQAFTVSSTGSFENLDPNLSWTNDEFTLTFWAKFNDINFTAISAEPEKQFDFIAVKEKENITGISDLNKIRFSSYLKKYPGDKLRAYFGLLNLIEFNVPDYIQVLFNFCDSYENLNLIQNPAKDHSITDYNIVTGPPAVYDLPYASEKQVRQIDMQFSEWHHFVVRSKVRKNGSEGICELWIDGKLRNRYIKYYQGNEEKTQNPGVGVFEESQLKPGGSILVPGLGSIPYPYYLKNSQDKLYLSNHSFFQIGKWNRVLTDLEINALYTGTINGVYTSRFSSISSPPRRKIQEIIGQNRLDDNSPFIDNRTTLNTTGYYGLNKNVEYFDGEEIYEMSGTLSVEVLQRDVSNIEKLKTPAFFDYVDNSLFDCIDGTKALNLIKIDVSSRENNTTLQYAGRTDSRFAKNVSNKPFSMLLSSSLFRHDRLAYEYTIEEAGGGFSTGIAGTGFLYYSPKRKNWIEKRNQHETSRLINTSSVQDASGSYNAIEINPYTVNDGNGGWLCYDSTHYDNSNQFNLDRMNVIVNDSQAKICSKLQVTGTSEILAQFTSSPQLGYFLNDENSLKKAGYENIGSPTIAFGAPFSPKYHAFDDETIKLNNFIDGPFELKKAVLRIPVEVQRINENVYTDYVDKYKPILYLNFEESGSAGDTVQDLSGNGNDGVLYGAATIDLSDTPTTGSATISGRGSLDLRYDLLTPDYLLINHDDDLKMELGKEKTISLWLKLPIFSFVGTNRYILFKGSTDGTLSEYYFFYDGATNSLTFRINSNTSSGYLNNYIGRRVDVFTISSIIGGLPYDVWFNVAITYDGTASSSGIKVYINSIEAFSIPSTNGAFVTPKIASHNIYIGSRGTSIADDVYGRLACLIYFNEVLTQTDIKSIYLSNLYSKRSGWNWTQNVISRKDLDNYVFFLYRQRRSNISTSFVDSEQDISSSVRFLIGSASLCVYNSSSFGLANRDGFIDYFGVDTPVTSSYSAGRTRTIYLNEMFRSSSDGIDPITYESVETISAPLHTPAFSINANLNNYETGSEFFRERMFLEIQIDPAYVLGGYPNNSLMYVTTSKGHLSTSFTFNDGLDTQASGFNPSTSNRIFNFYPQRGTIFNLNNTSSVPQITTVFQNFWFGGTRQPAIAYTGQYTPPTSLDTSLIKPYYQFDNKLISSTHNSLSQSAENISAYSIFSSKIETYNLSSGSPLFDIELSRTGLSVYNLIDEPFSKSIQLVFDGRGKLNAFEQKAIPVPATIFQRTDTIRSVAKSIETLNQLSGTFSIGDLKNANFSDLVSSLTVGYAPNSPAAGRNIYNPYILLPQDELVLGLDAGITPPPDIAPTFGKNLYDKVSSSGRTRQNAMINSIIKNDIWHYAGNSYLRVLPGEAELLLVGNYIRENNRVEYNNSKKSSNISTVIGNELISDQFDNAEYDAYAGTYVAQNFIGSIFDGTRELLNDDAIRSTNSGGTIKLFKTLNNEKIVILDQFVSGLLQ